MIRRTLRVLRWPFAVAIALIACAPQSPPASPEQDSGDGGGSFCERACNARAAAGCLEPALAAQCVPVCELSRERGVYRPCLRCEAYAGSDGQHHVRCVK